jgi:membrane dipeptidase
MLDHVDYVAKLVGPEHVAIGTDVVYSASNSQQEAKKLSGKRVKTRKAWHQLWPPNTYGLSENYPEQSRLSLEWTNWPLATVGLVQRGYSDEDVQKIIGRNVVRVAREALAAAKVL